MTAAPIRKGWGEWGGARWGGVSVGRNRSRQHEALGRGALAKRRGVGLEAGRWLGGMGYGWGRGACVAPSRRDVPAWRWKQCSRPSTPAPPPPPPPRASRPCRWQQLAASPPHARRRRSPTAAACVSKGAGSSNRGRKLGELQQAWAGWARLRRDELSWARLRRARAARAKGPYTGLRPREGTRAAGAACPF